MRFAGLAVLLVPLVGCVLSSTYQREVLHRTRVEQALQAREQKIGKLERKIRELETSAQNLTLEQKSFGDERVRLLEENEDLRDRIAKVQASREELRQALEKERQVRHTRESEIGEITDTYRDLVDKLEGEVESGQIEIHRLRGRLEVRALERILFDSGSTKIKAEGRAVLAKLSSELAALPGHTIHVQGHTDDLPISAACYPSNWELSAARAARVVRFLTEQGLDPRKLSAAGFAEYRPITGNDTPEGRARNRRIEIILVPQAED